MPATANYRGIIPPITGQNPQICGGSSPVR